MLANWMFFWVEADWVPAPPEPPAAPPAGNPSNAGGGGGAQRRQYERAGEDFWMVRERYLRRAMPRIEAIVKPAPVDKTNLPDKEDAYKVEALPPGGVLLQQALAAALQAARSAASAKALRDAMARAMQLALDISEIRQQYYNRAIALLLLDVF